MKIAAVKGHPLLSPPNEDITANLRVTVEDVRMMDDEFVKLRQDRKGKDLALHYYRLGQIGQKRPVAEEDRGLIAAALKLERNVGGTSPELLFNMRKIGLKVEVKDEEKTRMYDILGRKEFGVKKNIGPKVMFHHHMRGLDMPTTISPEDENALRGGINDARGGGDGVWLAHMHYYLQNLGFETTVSPDDWGMISVALENKRAERDGSHVALMHMFVEGLARQTRAPAHSKMPPLKKFGGEG